MELDHLERSRTSNQHFSIILPGFRSSRSCRHLSQMIRIQEILEKLGIIWNLKVKALYRVQPMICWTRNLVLRKVWTTTNTHTSTTLVVQSTLVNNQPDLIPQSQQKDYPSLLTPSLRDQIVDPSVMRSAHVDKNPCTPPLRNLTACHSKPVLKNNPPLTLENIPPNLNLEIHCSHWSLTWVSSNAPLIEWRYSDLIQLRVLQIGLSNSCRDTQIMHSEIINQPMNSRRTPPLTLPNKPCWMIWNVKSLGSWNRK